MLCLKNRRDTEKNEFSISLKCTFRYFPASTAPPDSPLARPATTTSDCATSDRTSARSAAAASARGTNWETTPSPTQARIDWLIVQELPTTVTTDELLFLIRPQREVELILLAYLSLPNKVPKKYARWLCRANESPGLHKALNQFQQPKICLQFCLF